MESDGLGLEIGDVLQLQFLTDESKTRYYVKVIGYARDKSLLVTTPQVKNKVMLVREGQAIAVRSLSGNNVVAFTVTVIRSNVKPYPYLHLSYPKELQAIKVRKAQRISCKTEAVVRQCGPEVSAMETPPPGVPVLVEDMSTTGALLIHDEPLGELKSLLSVEMLLNISDVEENISIIAIIRNIRTRNNEDGSIAKYLHGVEFQFADRQESIMLHAFICEQIVTGNATT
jgi:c-di-GMP-binding flagellar brake protein YcgR